MAIESSKQARFEKAIQMQEAGHLAQSLTLLSALAEEVPESSNLLCRKGYAEWEMEEREAAVISFRSAMTMAPESKAASLGLFHCLWELERFDEAFEEMKRFTAKTGSDAYMEIVRKVNSKATSASVAAAVGDDD